MRSSCSSRRKRTRNAMPSRSVLVAVKAQTQKLAMQIAEAEQTIAANSRCAEGYATRLREVTPWLDGVLAALPSEADLAHAAAESKWLDSRAAALLRETGDRRFRRPVRDPLHELRERLESLTRHWNDDACPVASCASHGV